MKKLIKFELIKTLNKKSFKLIIIFIILLSLFTSILVKDKKYENNNNYLSKEQILSTYNSNMKKQVNNLNKEIEKHNKKIKYEKNKNFVSYNDTKYKEDYIYNLIVILGMVMLIYSASAISGESKAKVLNRVLIMPYKRYKIILSKLISIILIFALLLILLLINYTLFTMILNNPKELLVDNLEIINNKVIEVNYFICLLKNVCIITIPIIFSIILTFSLSIITNNSSFSLSVAYIISTFSLVFTTFLLQSNIRIVEYTFFPYMDFTIFLDKINILKFNIANNCNLDLYKGIIVLIINSVVVYIISNIYFQKKDVN